MLKFIISCCIALTLVFSNAFATNKYLEAGIPASDRQWNGTDYSEAADKFSKGLVDLPTMADREGMILFKRIVSISNLELCKGKNTSPGTNLSIYAGILVGSQKIFAMYIEKKKYGANIYDELSEFSSFMLDVFAAGDSIVNTYIKTLDKNDINHAKIIENFKKSDHGIIQMFVACERTLSDNKLTQSNINTIAIAMNRTLPVLKSRFSNNFKEELRVKLESRHKKATDATLKNVLKSMINELGPSSA
jgi:hypothetical protein